ncbi:5'-nucleotidase C-terminal domain-containing protein [Marinibacterium sp. SX1]|uniref:5'-nucleotidase C-terminal domain-containing protein n=1 Tax=Marinibacterium sp. SX1 TaxID=3388424 RepID=UPI003D176388
MIRPQAQDDGPDRPGDGRFGLRILATTDLHMHLSAHNYFTDRPAPGTGLVHLASLVRAARAEARARGDAVLLLDNGDSLQGTPMEDLHPPPPPPGPDGEPAHPMMLAMAELGYDAIGLGNHDFDFGIARLAAILRRAPCPVIGSNLVAEGGETLAGLLPDVRAELRLTLPGPDGAAVTVGLLSVLPPQTAQWNAHHLAGRLGVADMVDTVRRAAARLKAGGCDLVILLAHSGLGSGDALPGAENAVIPLAGLGAVDAVIAGHTHLLLPGPAHAGLAHVEADTGRVHGTPVVMPGAAGSHLGVIDLTLHLAAGGWRIGQARSALRAPMPDDAADPALVRRLAPAHRATTAALDRPVGHAARRLHSYFTLFGPDHALALTADAQLAAMRPAIAAAGLDHLPVLSAVAPSKFGARGGPLAYTDVPAGPVTLRHVADLHAYRNELRVVRVSGAQVADWLEMSAGLFRHLPPGGGDGWLLGDDVAGYNFDVLHGLRYGIDPTRPARFDAAGRLLDPGARRVRDLRLGGRALAGDADVLVVTNSYRTGGGGNFPGLAEAAALEVPPIELRRAIADHFRSGGGGDGFAPPWRLAGLAGGTVRVRTGPGAGDLVTELAAEPLGVDSDGFLELRLRP